MRASIESGGRTANRPNTIPPASTIASWLANQPLMVQRMRAVIRNMFNSFLVGVGRYNAQENGYLRVYLNEPRSFRLTLSADY